MRIIIPPARTTARPCKRYGTQPCHQYPRTACGIVYMCRVLEGYSCVARERRRQYNVVLPQRLSGPRGSAPPGPLTTAIGYGFPLGKPSEPLTVPRTRLRSLTARAECSDLQRLRPLYDQGIWQNDPPGFTTSFDAYNTSDVLRGPLGLSLGAGDQIVVAAASFNNLTGSNSQERIRFGNFDPPGFSSSFWSILPMAMLSDSDEHALVRIPSILLSSMTGSYAACQHDSCECTHLDHEKINAPGAFCLPAFDLDGDNSDLSIVSGLPAADPLDPSYCGYAARFVNHLTHGNLNGTMQTAHLFLAVAVRLADY